MLGRGGEAAAIVTEAAADSFEHVPWESTRSNALAMSAAQAGATGAAAVLYELIEPWADQLVWNGTNAFGHNPTYLGLLAAALGRDEQADEHFARACQIQERDEMLVWAARALELARERGYGLLEPRAVAIVEAPIATGN